MQYVLRVWLYGGLSREFFRPLSQITLSVHQSCADRTINRKSGSRIVGFIDHRGVRSIGKSILIAEGTTDAAGTTDLYLNSSYTGGHFEVSIKSEIQNPEKKHLIHLATLTPAWVRDGEEHICSWNYCLFPRSTPRRRVPDPPDYGNNLPSTPAGKRIRTSVPTPGVE